MNALAAMNRRRDVTEMLDSVWCVDALTLLGSLPDASIDLICTDPPYNIGKDNRWDKWHSVDGFIAWLDEHLMEFRRVLKPNGSLYLFAAPQHAARVEVAISKRFNVLNHISWWKNTGNRNWAADKEAIRAYLPNTEHIIFAEQYGVGGITPVGDAIRTARQKAGLKATDIDIALGYVRTKDPTRGTELCRRWEEGSSIPTENDFSRAMVACGASGSYASLKAQYDDLRRPFNLSADEQFADVWFFDPVQTYPGKHPCEKPLDMMRHIIRASSRLDDVVCDPFCGSGATLKAAKVEGRYYIGGDNDPHWVYKSLDSLRTPYAPRPVVETRLDDLPLFAIESAVVE